MKSVNFMGTIPPKTRASLHRWAVVSVVTILFMCVALLAVYMCTYYRCRIIWSTCQKLQNSKGKMLSFLQDKRLLKNQEALFQQQALKVMNLYQKQKKITNIVEFFAQLQEAPVTLQSLELKKKLATITLHAKSLEDIFAYIARLEQQTLFASVALQSLEVHHEYVWAVVHATLH